MRFNLFVIGSLAAVCWLPVPAQATIVSDWSESALAEVRLGRLGPPIVARALAVAHTCMYDAWAAYDARAVATVLGTSLRRPAPERTEANKAKAISFAAHRCLVNLFPSGAARLDAAMRGRGFDPTDRSTDIATPQGIGNVAANAVINARRHDGANQYGELRPGAYADYTGYAPRNPPLPYCLPQSAGPCALNIADPLRWQPLVSETGATQRFIAPHWERVTPFALTAADQFDNQPDIVPLPNFLRGPAQYLADVDSMLRFSAGLDLQGKLSVEYWADGPDSELPPGHWALFAQYVSQRDRHSIDKDVQMFFAMHNASLDAGIVAWHLKRKYDGVRPISAVRYLRQGTQVLAWGGPGRPIELIAGEKWTPYNPGSNLTPAFPGFISGHSTFSSASATVLRTFTGSDRFGFSTVLPINFGRVEPNIPPIPTTISYATFSDATDDAGLSRLYAGIHFADDNVVGQKVGALIGQQAWAKARFLFDGGLAIENSSSSLDDDKSATLTWSHTVSARSNGLLVVSVSYRDGNQPVRSVHYGGRALSLLGAQNAPGNDNRVELWHGTAPAAGTADVVVTLSKARRVIGGAMSFTGVDQKAPFGISRSASGKTESACVTLANAPAALVVSVLAANGDAKLITSEAGQAPIWNTATGTSGGDVLSTGSAVAGAPIATLCQSLKKGKPWSLFAVPLMPAVAPE